MTIVKYWFEYTDEALAIRDRLCSKEKTSTGATPAAGDCVLLAGHNGKVPFRVLHRTFDLSSRETTEITIRCEPLPDFDYTQLESSG